jgi:hypothetical protein
LEFRHGCGHPCRRLRSLELALGAHSFNEWTFSLSVPQAVDFLKVLFNLRIELGFVLMIIAESRMDFREGQMRCDYISLASHFDHLGVRDRNHS